MHKNPDVWIMNREYQITNTINRWCGQSVSPQLMLVYAICVFSGPSTTYSYLCQAERYRAKHLSVTSLLNRFTFARMNRQRNIENVSAFFACAFLPVQIGFIWWLCCFYFRLRKKNTKNEMVSNLTFFYCCFSIDQNNQNDTHTAAAAADTVLWMSAKSIKLGHSILGTPCNVCKYGELSAQFVVHGKETSHKKQWLCFGIKMNMDVQCALCHSQSVDRHSQALFFRPPLYLCSHSWTTSLGKNVVCTTNDKTACLYVCVTFTLM